MAELTDRELINQYSSMWLPKKQRSKTDYHGQTSERILEIMQGNEKEYNEFIEELRCHDKRRKLEEQIEELCVKIQLTTDWKDRERLEGQRNKLWDELANLKEEK